MRGRHLYTPGLGNGDDPIWAIIYLSFTLDLLRLFYPSVKYLSKKKVNQPNIKKYG